MEPSRHSSILIIFLSSILLFYSVDATFINPLEVAKVFTAPFTNSKPNEVSAETTTEASSAPLDHISISPSQSPLSSPLQPQQSTVSASLSQEKTQTQNLPNDDDPTIPHLPNLHDIAGAFGIKFNVELKNICHNTDYPELCLTSINPFFTGGNTDPFSILELAIQACKKGIQIAVNEAVKVSSAISISPDVRRCIADCKDNFDDAMANVQSAIDAIPKRDIPTMQTMLSAVITDAETCSDGFMEAAMDHNPFDGHVDMLHKLASNCLAIAELCK